MVVGQVLYIMLGRRTGATFLDIATAVPTTLMALQALFTCAVVGLFTFETMPLVETARAAYTAPGSTGSPHYHYPLQSYFIHCLNLDSAWQYALGYFYLFASSVTTHMVLYIATDLLLVSLTIDLCTAMNLLQIDLEEVFRSDDLQCIKAVVTRHQKLLWVAAELSDIFGLHVFVQMSFSSVIICCFGFLTVIAEGLLLNNLFAALGVSLAMWTLCWPGQLLLDTSLGISEAAYTSEWYNRGVDARRYIVIIMSRAQRPCYLTALGFSNLTVANFSKILSSSWSYLSLLHQMYQDAAP